MNNYVKNRNVYSPRKVTYRRQGCFTAMSIAFAMTTVIILAWCGFKLLGG